MSAVLTSFKENPKSDDPLHVELSKITTHKARLLQIRKDMLACCGCEEAASGAVKLMIVDTEGYAKLKAEQVAIIAKLDALDILVQKLDAVFEDVSRAGFNVRTKTARGLRAAEVNWRATYGHRETDDWGHPLPTKPNHELLKLTEKAEALMAELAGGV